MIEINRPGIPKLGDTVYVPVKVDRVVTTNRENGEEITCYGGYLKCCQPWNSERQQIRVYFDEEYISGSAVKIEDMECEERKQGACPYYAD